MSDRKLLVLDTHFTLESIRQRGLEDSILCRDLRGYFSRVWNVQPLASLLTSEQWSHRYGKPVTYTLNETHQYIEGKIGRFRKLAAIAPLNLLIAQFGLLLMLVRIVREEKISVIRAHDPLYCGLFAWLLSKLTGVPYMIRVGSNNDKMFEITGEPMMPRLFGSRRIEKRIEHFTLSRADLVAGANQNNLDFAIRAGARPDHSTLFRYGNLVDQRHWSEPSERSVDPGLLSELGVEPGKFMLYVGRYEQIKFADHIVPVLADVRARGFDVKAVLAGDGSLRKQMEAQAAELGVGEHLILAGNRDQGWISKAVTQAAVVISPHMGRALTEVAMGAAPIVAYDYDWQGEIIETDVTGILVPHEDKRAMADGVVKMLSDRGYAKAMGQAARLRAFAMSDPEVLDRHERDSYERLIAQRGGNA